MKRLLTIITVFILIWFAYDELWVYHIDGPGFRSLEDTYEVSNDEVFSFLVTGGRVKNSGTDTVMLCDVFTSSFEDINMMKPDFMFINGDVMAIETAFPFGLEAGRNPEKEMKLFSDSWDQIEEKTKVLEMPVHYVPGNHDVYSIPAKRNYEQRVGTLHRSFTYKNARFVILNSCKTETQIQDPAYSLETKWFDPNPIDVEQLGFLAKGLEEEWQEDYKFIFLHHDPKVVPNWETEVQSILKKYKNVIVFSGTRGGTMRYDSKDGIHYFDGGMDDRKNKLSYYLKVTIDGNNFHCDVVPVYPKDFMDKMSMRINLLTRYWKKHF